MHCTARVSRLSFRSYFYGIIQIFLRSNVSEKLCGHNLQKLRGKNWIKMAKIVPFLSFPEKKKTY